MAEIISLKKGSCIWNCAQDDKFSSCLRRGEGAEFVDYLKDCQLL